MRIFSPASSSPNSEVWGRPVGVAVDRTGAILVGEDGNSTLWRITKK